MIYSVVRWLVFVVALSLLPVGISAFSIVTRVERVSFVGLLGHGDLLLVSTAIVGAGLADLVSAGKPQFRTLKLVVGGSAGLVALAAAVWFAEIAAIHRDGLPVDYDGIAVGSLVVFGLAVITGLSCVVIGEVAKSQ